MSNLGKIVYLSEAQLTTLIHDGSITVDGKTVTYNENDIYMTPSQPNIPAGGSSGQVLKKNSGTDYDVAWVNDDEGALSAAMTYVIRGNKSIESVTIPVGAYVRLVDSTITGRSDGIYTVATAIPVDTIIDGTYFNESAPIPGGVANALNASLTVEDISSKVSFNAGYKAGCFRIGKLAYISLYVDTAYVTSGAVIGTLASDIRPTVVSTSNMHNRANGNTINNTLNVYANGDITIFGTGAQTTIEGGVWYIIA